MLRRRGTTSQESSVQAFLGVLPTRLSLFLIELTPSLLLWMQTCALPSSVEGVREIECEEEDVATAVLLFTVLRLFISLFTQNILRKIPIPNKGMLLVRELAPGHRQTFDAGSNVSSASATHTECYFLTIYSWLVLCSVLYVRTKCPPSGTKRMRSLAKGRKTMSISVSVSKLGGWVVPFSCRYVFCTNDFALRHSTECSAGVLWAWHRTQLLLCESGNYEHCAVGGWLETTFVWQS